MYQEMTKYFVLSQKGNGGKVWQKALVINLVTNLHNEKVRVVYIELN